MVFNNLLEWKEKLGQAESEMFFWCMSSLIWLGALKRISLVVGSYDTSLRPKNKSLGVEQWCWSITNKTNSYSKAFGYVPKIFYQSIKKTDNQPIITNG